MTALNLEEINLNTRQLFDLARTESEVTICEHGQPRFKVIALSNVATPVTRRPEPGIWKGRVWMADDFDELPEEIAAAFRGELE